MARKSPSPHRFIASLGGLVAVSVLLLAIRMVSTDSFRYGFMFWNLFLAAVPLGLAWLLVQVVRKEGWQDWPQAVLLLAWILFLPNSFYVITDLMHLEPNYEADLLFDVTMLMSFTLISLIFGFSSVYLVHREAAKRMKGRKLYGLLAVLFLACSFAICLGRYTRWNTWDVLLQPAGLLYDVSDRLLNPGSYLQTYETTVTMFSMLFSTYIIICEAIRLLRR